MALLQPNEVTIYQAVEITASDCDISYAWKKERKNKNNATMIARRKNKMRKGRR